MKGQASEPVVVAQAVAIPAFAVVQAVAVPDQFNEYVDAHLSNNRLLPEFFIL